MKRIISISMAMILLITSMIVIPLVATADAIDVWDTTVASSFEGGTGTSGDPFLIKTPEQLAKVLMSTDTSGKFYSLINDIYLNDVTKSNWQSLSPNSWYDRNDINKVAFAGNFDGAGYTIYGLYYNGSNIVSLFPQANNATITNLRISNSKITSAGAVAAFVAFGQGSLVFDKCIADETVVLTNTVTSGEVGVSAFVSYGSPKIQINNSAVMATIEGAVCKGAFIGNIWGNTTADRLIKNSFSATDAPITGHKNNAVTVENCYSVGTEKFAYTGTVNKLANADMMKGAAAQTNMPKLNWNSVWQTTDSGYPTYRDANGEVGAVWSGNVAGKYAGGNGTKDDPYLIETPEQLARMVKVGDTNGGYYKLTADIYLNDVSKSNWTSNSPNVWYDRNDINKTAFVGNLDGDGYTIYGLYYNGSNIVGLFPQANNTTITNLRISYSEITGSNVISALVGFGQGTLNFKKCIVDETVKLTNTATSGEIGVAGFVGYGSPKIYIEDSAVMATITGAYRNGAFIGNVWGNTAAQRVIKNSFSAVNTALSAHPTQGFTVENVYTIGTEHPQQEISGTVYKLDNADKMKGTAAKTNMPKLIWTIVWKPTQNGYPELSNGEVVLDPDIWDGSVATGFASGTGTKEDPFVIKNAEQLVRMTTLGDETAGKYYVLGNDIKINDVNVDSWQYYAKSWKITSSYFQGHFDGAGYTIYGLYYEGDQSYAALIQRVKGDVSIKNLYLDDCEVKSSGYGIAALIGYVNSSTVEISKVFAREGVFVKSTSTNATEGSAAGFVAYGQGTVTIDSCAFLGTVECAYQKAAFTGNIWNSTKIITNSFTTAAIPFNSKQTISDSSKGNYGVGISLAEENGVIRLESAEDMKGLDAKSKMPKLNWINVWKTSNAGYPQYLGADEIDITIWNGTIATDFAGGEGTERNPYKIANGAQLAKMATDGDLTKGKYYVLTADIKLNDVSAENWTDYATAWVGTSAVFQGNLDGDGHTVYGLYYSGSDKSSIGLVSRVSGEVSFRRVAIANAYFETHNNEGSAAAFIGWITNGAVARFSRCYIADTVTCVTANTAAGFVANGSGKIYIDNCASLGHYESPKRHGSMVGGIYWSNTSARTVSIKKSFAIEAFSNYFVESIYDSYCVEKLTNNTVVQASILKNIDSAKGAAAKKNMPKLDWKNIWVKVDGAYPVINFGSLDGKVGAVWSGAIADNYAGGTGTKNDPYLISTPEQLAKLCSDLTACRDKYYKLTADIYLNRVSNKNWMNAGGLNEWFWASASKDTGFDGNFNGNGHVVYGMYLNLKQTTNTVYTGLFSAITDGAVIRKVGISDAYMKITFTNESEQSHYIGGIAGSVFYKDNNKPRNPAYISQCFGSNSVHLEGWGCGGIVHGMPRPVVIEDCYYVGSLKFTLKGGAIIGDTWLESKYTNAAVRRCYSATDEGNYLAAGRAGVTNSFSTIGYKDNYSTYLGLSSFQTRISMLMMRGADAKKNMVGFDFDNVWYALPNGTPVLRAFGKTDKFSNTNDPKPIEVSFVSNGGTECESLYGNPEEPIDLPTPKKAGYKFVGWYVYKELDIKYEYDFFPYFDQVLYAKWESTSLIQDFEQYTNTKYDYGEDYEYFRPGTAGYDATYIKSGTSSMHRKGTGGSADFLVFYDQLLKVGDDYEMVFYINTDAKDTSVNLSLVHEDTPDIYGSDSGVESIKSIKTVKMGEWTKVTYTFTAKTKWIAIRTSGNASIYFDDFMVTSLSDDAANASSNGILGIIGIILMVVGILFVLTIGTVVAIIVIKTKKRKNKN